MPFLLFFNNIFKIGLTNLLLCGEYCGWLIFLYFGVFPELQKGN